MKTRSILITGGGLILAALVLGTLMPFLIPTMGGGSTYGGMMGGYGMMTGFGGFGMIVMALFWVGVVLLVVWGVRNAFTPQQPRVDLDAETILKQRFAHGEINRDEFTQARDVLHSAPHA